MSNPETPAEQIPTQDDPAAADAPPADDPAQDAAEQGPLQKLTDAAANSAFVQKVSDNVPSVAKPLLQKGGEYVQPVAGKAIHAVDTTLKTDEAQKVASSTIDLLHAVTAFTLIVLTWTVSSLESTLDIPADQTTETTEQTTTTDKEVSGDDASKVDGYRRESVELLHRYKIVAYALFMKASEYVKEKKASSATAEEDTQNEQQQQQRETYDPHSIDKLVSKHAKKGVAMAKQIGAYSLSRASTYTGPASSAIAPTAQYVISKLPEDSQKVVNDSTSPF